MKRSLTLLASALFVAIPLTAQAAPCDTAYQAMACPPAMCAPASCAMADCAMASCTAKPAAVSAPSNTASPYAKRKVYKNSYTPDALCSPCPTVTPTPTPTPATPITPAVPLTGETPVSMASTAAIGTLAVAAAAFISRRRLVKNRNK